MHAAASLSEPKTSDRIIWQPSPPCPTSCETLAYPQREGRGTQAPNLLVHKNLRAEKPQFCWVKLRTKPSKALQRPSDATRGCQAACKPIFIGGKGSPRSLWTRVGEGSSSGPGDVPGWPAPALTAAWLGAVRGSARLSCPSASPLRARLLFLLLLGNPGEQSQGMKTVHMFVLKANYLVVSCSLCQNATRIKAQLCYR